jgi:hypothetical protein
VSDRIGGFESEVARIAGVFQETNGAVSAESAARVNFEQKVQADVQNRFWSYRCDIAMFMKDIALSVNDFKSRTVHVEQRLSEYAVANGERHDAVSIVSIPRPDTMEGTPLTPLEETAQVVLEANEPSIGGRESLLRNRRGGGDSRTALNVIGRKLRHGQISVQKLKHLKSMSDHTSE